MSTLKKIVILGGGTAGWMAANLMAKKWKNKPIAIYLIESPCIGIVGVGEGSTPTLKAFFNHMNIAESEWMPACNATYKLNIRFNGWSPSSPLNSYSHPFKSQVDVHSERSFFVNCLTRRLGLNVTTDPELFFLNGVLAQKKLKPEAAINFPFNTEYGYHFDSALLGTFLKEKAVALGVTHYQGKVTSVEQHIDGSIKHLVTDANNVFEGDFFIDCSGFEAVLMRQKLKVKFTSFSDNLFNDSAVVIPTNTPYDNSIETISTALSAGWAWEIPLANRQGNGYVYSSQFIDSDKAERELRDHLGIIDKDVNAKHLKMNIGQLESHWSKNCLALGLSQGFIEPLEATALHLVQTSIDSFITLFEQGDFTNKYQTTYNKIVNERFESVRDYIVAHYKLNSRHDSDYWKENRENLILSDALLHILDCWYKGKELTQEVVMSQTGSQFSLSSWHCLLAGNNVFPSLAVKQPGVGDLYREYQLENFYANCSLNFASII